MGFHLEYQLMMQAAMSSRNSIPCSTSDVPTWLAPLQRPKVARRRDIQQNGGLSAMVESPLDLDFVDLIDWNDS